MLRKRLSMKQSLVISHYTRIPKEKKFVRILIWGLTGLYSTLSKITYSPRIGVTMEAIWVGLNYSYAFIIHLKGWLPFSQIFGCRQHLAL